MKPRFRSPIIWILTLLFTIVLLRVFHITDYARDDNNLIGMTVKSSQGKHVAPALTLPPQKLPDPNAFDYYVKAGNALVDIQRIEDMHNDLTAKRSLVTTNAKALELLWEGFGHPFCYPRTRSQETPDDAKTILRLSQLLTMHLEVNVADHDTEGIAKSALANVLFGTQVQHAGPINISFVGVNSLITGNRCLHLIINRLDAKTARVLGKKLEQIFAHQVTCANSMQEYLYWMDMALQKGLHDTASSSVKQRYMNKYAQYMQGAMENAKLPYTKQRRLPKPPAILSSAFPANTFNYLREMPLLFTKRDTQERLLLVALALRAYRVEHEKHPAKLDDLVPKYLSKLPDDPFLLSGTFHYSRTGKEYLLYSVGPDGRDDGGKIIENTSAKTMFAGYKVDADSKGDFLAGKNW